MLPDTDFVIFCNPPGGHSQGWHRDTRVYGAGGDWSGASRRSLRPLTAQNGLRSNRFLQ